MWQLNALASTRTQLQPVPAQSVLTPLGRQQRLGIESEIARPTAAGNEKRNASKSDAYRQTHPKYGSGSSKRSDFHYQGIVGTPAGSSNDDLPSAPTGTLARLPRRQQLAVQPRGDRTVGARSGRPSGRKSAAPPPCCPPPPLETPPSARFARTIRPRDLRA